MTRQMLLHILVLGCWLPCTSSCAEHMRIQESKDPMFRYSYVKKYYNEGKYSRVAEPAVDVLPHCEDTQKGAQALYIMADALLQNKQESSIVEYFRRLYSEYPQDARAAEVRYKTGLTSYRITPDPHLGQFTTYSVLRGLQGFLKAYPQGEHHKEVEQILFDLQDDLAKKELITAGLYYNLGTYIGNNYISAIITTRNAPKACPYIKYREDLLFIIAEASYQQAINSTGSEKQGRLHEVIDACYNYENTFSNGKHLKRAKTLRDRAQCMIVS